MGIFIPDHTTCAVCERVIERRRDAVQLPYLHPSTGLPAGFMTRPFLHRVCWSTWPRRNRASDGAERLIRESAADDSVRRVRFMEDHLAIEEWSAGFVRLQDLRHLVVLDIPVKQILDFTQWLGSAPHTDDEPFRIGGLTLTLSSTPTALDFRVTDNVDDVLMRFELAADRCEQWKTALARGAL